jgi:hypothetical protein
VLSPFSPAKDEEKKFHGRDEKYERRANEIPDNSRVIWDFDRGLLHILLLLLLVRSVILQTKKDARRMSNRLAFRA